MMGTMEEVDMVMKRLGDEQSTLLDRFERLSFEVQLNQAMLGRSLSEPSTRRYQPQPQPQPLVSKVSQGRRNHHHHHHHRHRGLGFQRVWNKVLKPIFGRWKGERKEINGSLPDHQKDFKFIKAFTRSLRV